MKYLSIFERWFNGIPFLWLLLICWQPAVTASELGLFGGQGIRDVFAEFDLLLAIKIPPEEGITFVDGSDGFPAFGVASNADIKSPYRTILPEKLTEFTIIATVRPGTRSGGYIFSVVNPLDTVVQLGLLLEPILSSDQWNVTLMYTDANVQRVSQPLASFQIPYTKSWIKLIFKVMNNQIVFYNNCVETETVTVKKEPRMLIFDAASTLYIAQAGPILKRSFEGTLLFLKLYGNPEIVKTHCNRTATELDDSSNVIYEEDDFLRDSDDIGDELFSDDHIGLSSGDDDDSLFEPPMISPPPPEYGYRSKGDKGERGPKGPPGDAIRGPPGPPGPQGSPGPPGPPGAAGPKGSGLFDEGSGDDAIYDAIPNRKFSNQCFCNVTLIMEELKMDSTLREYLRGPEGPKGREGKTGSPGLTGATGPAGERGVAGPKGDKGDRGEPGLPGTEGIQGSKGESGLDGMPGPAGLPGSPGPPGIPENYDGHTSIGAPGPKGSVGPSGVPGIPGQTGSTGPKGDKGNTGDVGPAGPAGPPGVVVYTDAKNSTGTTDCHCQQGPPGPPGVRGPMGHDGTPGLPGETGLPGHPGLPGDKGDKGNAGSKGEKGPEFIINENASFNSTRTTKGEKGERGPRGRRGKPGPIGPPGKSASPSDMGINSWSTLKGDKGPKGDRGDVGLRGPKGESGKDGIDGKPGPPGQYIPLPGPPGPPGPPGLPGVSIAGEKGDPGMDSRSPYFGDPNFIGRAGSRSSLDELKQLRELKHHRELEDSTAGPPGPPGPPGRGYHYDSSDSEMPPTRIVPGAVTFQNTETMSRMSSTSPVGTLAYIIDEEALLVRVNKGWQYIALGTLVPIATPAPPTTTVIPPPHRPDLQASNLINNIPQPLEGPFFTATPEYESLRMGALNEPFSGDMQGIRGADYNCYRQARRAGLLGTFRAFLSSRITNLDTIVRIADRGLPVVNTRGDVLFNSWNSIFNGQGGYFPQTPRIYSFSGKNVLTDITWPQKLVWHGASALGERAMDTYCDSWHSDSTDKVGLASSLLGNKLLDQDRYSCDNRFIVLCVEALPHEQRRRKRDVSRHTIEFTNEDDYNRHLAEVLQET